MSEVGEALELMHTAISRWQTLRVEGREWQHTARAAVAWDRSTPRVGRTVIWFRKQADEPEPEETEERWRLWLAKPDRMRAEFAVGQESVTVVFAGSTWWSWSPSRGAMTNAGDPHHGHGTGPGDDLIDPARILPAVELEVVGRSAFLGRPTIEVVARPSPLDENDEEVFDLEGATHGLGSRADAYRLFVDAERGILLRAEALIGGAPFRVLEITEVGFDEDLPKNTFTPPAAAEFERVESPRIVSLADLPGAVPFVVLVPERPPFGPPQARIDPANRRRGVSLQVHIDYMSPFSGEENRQFSLIESADPIPERTSLDWRDDGDIRLGEDRSLRPVLRIVRLDRLETHVEIQSHALSMEELRHLAQSLVPLPPNATL